MNAGIQFRAFIPFSVQSVPDCLSKRIEWLCRRYAQSQTIDVSRPTSTQVKKWRRFWRTITPIERSIAHWLCLAGKYVALPVSEKAWLYEPPTVAEIFALAKLKHDIVRHYLPANDLKILISVCQASNYEFLSGNLVDMGLLAEKAITDVAERFVNADSLDGEFQYELDVYEASDYRIIEQQLYLNDVRSAPWICCIKYIIDVSMRDRIHAAINGAYLTFPPQRILFTYATGEITFDFPRLDTSTLSTRNKNAANIH